MSWGLREPGEQRKTQLQSKGTWENEHPTPQHSAQSWHHRSLNQHSAGTHSSTVQTCRAHRRGAFKGSETCSVRTLSAVFTVPSTPYPPCGHRVSPAQMHVFRHTHTHMRHTQKLLCPTDRQTHETHILHPGTGEKTQGPILGTHIRKLAHTQETRTNTTLQHPETHSETPHVHTETHSNGHSNTNPIATLRNTHIYTETQLSTMLHAGAHTQKHTCTHTDD